MQPYLARAWHCIEVKRWQLALRELQAVVGQHAQDAQVHYFMAFCLMRLGHAGEAEAAARQALEIEPHWPTVLNLLADLCIESQRLAAAEEWIQQSLQASATKSDTFRVLARMKYVQEDYAGALQASETGLACDADDCDCLLLRAKSLQRLDRTSEAKAAYQAVLSRDPEHAEAHSMLGWIDFEAERGRHGVEHFRTALQLDPTDQDTRRMCVNVIKWQSALRLLLWFNELPYVLRFVLLVSLALIGVSARFAWEWFSSTKSPAPILLFLAVFITAIARYEVVIMRKRELQFFLSPTDRHRSDWLCVTFCLAAVFLILAYWCSGGWIGVLVSLAFSLCGFGFALDPNLNPKTRQLELALWSRLAVAVPLALLPLIIWGSLYAWTGVDPFTAAKGGWLGLITLVFMLSPIAVLFATSLVRIHLP